MPIEFRAVATDNDRSAELLDSWKEIAVFLNRGVRTVQRWQAEGLPVHRQMHTHRGSVFAFTSEIRAWLKSREQAPQSHPIEFVRNGYRHLTPGLMAVTCVAARVRAQNARRQVQMVCEQHQTEIARLVANLNAYLARARVRT